MTAKGTYFTLPFTMPPGIESFTLTYRYERHHQVETGVEAGIFTSRQEINIIDLGLIAPDGTQVGASGSDKTEIYISETAPRPVTIPARSFPGNGRSWWAHTRCARGREGHL